MGEQGLITRALGLWVQDLPQRPESWHGEPTWTFWSFAP